MKILITGATGIIGTKLINKLNLIENYRLRILVRKNEIHNFNSKIELFEGDLLDPDSLNRATLNTDIVLHLAGITHTNKKNLYYNINTLGTENLLRACEKNNVGKFIFISSRAAGLGGGSYAKSKYLAEKKVKLYKNNWIILSLAEVYGAGKKEAISRLINFIEKNYFIPIIGNGGYKLSPIFIDDVIMSMVNSIRHKKIYRQKYIIAGPEELTYIEIVDKLVKKTGKKRVKIYIPKIFFKIMAFFMVLLKNDIMAIDQIPRLLCKKPYNIDLAKKDLEFRPMNFENGIEKIFENINN